MKIIVAGSRTIKEYQAVWQGMIDSGYWKKYGRNIEIVCGMAQGVDLLGKEFAIRNDLICHEFPADWDKHGYKAEYLRNIEMGKFADGLLAVWDGKSRETKQMIEWATDNYLEVYVYVYNEVPTRFEMR